MKAYYITSDNTNILLSTINQLESMTLQITCILSKDQLSFVGVDHDHNTCIMVKIPCKTNNTKQGGNADEYTLTTTSTELSKCFNTYLDGVNIQEANDTAWILSNNKVLRGNAGMPAYIRKDLKYMEVDKQTESMKVCTKYLLSCILYTSLCESFVTISRTSDGRLHFDTCGELLAIHIQLNDYVYKPDGIASCTCIFKYTRSLLSSLHKYETVNIELVHEKFVRIFTDDSTLNMLFFHNIQKKKRKRNF